MKSINILNDYVILEVWAFEVQIIKEDLEYILIKHYKYSLNEYIDRDVDEDGFVNYSISLINVPFEELYDAIYCAIIYDNLKYSIKTKTL